ELELSSWIMAEDRWPQARTREMFDASFDVELGESVYDLMPGEPLNQREADFADMLEAQRRCASCGLQLEDHEGQYATFKLADPESFAPFRGRVLPLTLNEDEELLAIVSPADSDEAVAGEDVLVRVCSSQCEKVVRTIVRKALQRVSRQL